MSADLNSSPEIDVVIIGAGLSGLQAARSLQDAGLKTLVLEARSRVGGMTWTVAGKDGTGISDLGAEWLNDTTQPHVYQLALKLGLEVSEVKVSGDAIFQGLDKGTVRHAYGEQAPVSHTHVEVFLDREIISPFANSRVAYHSCLAGNMSSSTR